MHGTFNGTPFTQAVKIYRISNKSTILTLTLFEEIGGLNHPVFTCPVWNITTKFPGTNINSYASSNLTSLLDVEGGFCQDPTQMRPGDLLPPLNPAVTDCSFPIKPFAQCKNNCPGGRQ